MMTTAFGEKPERIPTDAPGSKAGKTYALNADLGPGNKGPLPLPPTAFSLGVKPGDGAKLKNPALVPLNKGDQ